MVVARRYLIRGRVQGVGYRAFARAAATRDGLAGLVRNLPDGRVEVEAEGDGGAVERFESALRQGPPGARVDGMTTEPLRPGARRPPFRIDTGTGARRPNRWNI